MLTGARPSIAVFAVFAILIALFLPVFLPPAAIEPVEIVESLHDPISVTGWDDDGLILPDGSRVSLPGVLKLPADSQVLRHATVNGVETTPDGRVVGLVRVHHWCGNDPVRNHVARVDLAHMLMFMREVEFDEDHGQLAQSRDPLVGIPFSEYGWRVGNFLHFQAWSKLAAERGI